MVKRLVLVSIATAMAAATATAQDGDGSISVSGELRRWHKVTLTLSGPQASETGSPNPFLDYRFEVTFTNGGTSYTVPGYFAADGNAANTSATSGNRWRAHFAPDKTGTWNYTVVFTSGSNVAVNGGGSTVAPYHGKSGSFSVSETNKTGRDLRAKGRLDYVGGHFLRFAGNGEYFLKQGADAPENFLAYQDFDGPFKTDGQKDNLVKDWSPHAGDWASGDPTWKNGKGKGIIGAINYLASEGMTAFSFLTMNIAGDDRNVFPYLDYNERRRIDVSRMDQWGVVFEHGTRKGFFLHFKTQETENELLLNSGNLGVERKLYYRELIARFAHNLALNWNLGEEINNATTAQKQAWAQYFWDTDPYHHHIVIHNGSNHYDLLGNASKLTGFSLQTNQADFSNVHGRVLDYLNRSDAAGKPWAVACDEPGDASHALRPDDDAGNSHVDGRKNGVWGTFMAGGWGNEWYFGYQHHDSDLTCNDFRSRDRWWDYCRYALEFFKNNQIPVWEMVNDNGKSSNSADYCYFKAGQVYVVYLKNGGTTNLDLNGVGGTYDVKWFDPRNGGGLQNGSVTQVSGGGSRNLGNAPNNGGQDWAILVRLSGSTTTYSLNVVNGSGDGDYAAGSQISISANPAPAGQIFDRWTGDTGVVGDIFSASTTVTMPSSNVTVTATYKDDTGTGQSVASFTLVNADTDADIGPLQNGATINLSVTGSNLSVRANTNPSTVGSVRFGLDGNANFQTESAKPYALAGDSNGDYNAWTPSLGQHTLTGTPYTQSGGGGTAGTSLTVTFTVVDSTSLPTVTVAATDAQAGETGPDAGTFTVTRSGSTSGDLTVIYSMSGSATNGTDYQALSGDVTIPGGQASATVTLTPIDDASVEGSETATLSIDTDASYTIGSSGSATVTIADNDSAPPPGQSPFGGSPRSIPGTIQAEDFDEGGEGVAFHDTTSGNSGNQYRTTDVDVQTTSDSGGGYNVGWIAAGEWLEYTVDVTTASTYSLEMRVASTGSNGALHVELDGANLTGSVAVPNTGGWQSWTTLTVDDIVLTSGQKVLRLFMDGSNFNVNWIRFTETAPPPPPPSGQAPFGGTPWSIPGTIQAEDFDEGGEGVAFHDTTSGNSGNQYRTTDVDVQTTGDTGGGYNVGWIAAGEWLEYTVDVTTASTYQLELRVASTGSNGALHVELDGANLTGSVAVPNTGGWQSWTTLTVDDILLSQGQGILRIFMDGSNFNVNWIRFTDTGQPPPPPPTPEVNVLINDPAASEAGPDAGSFEIFRSDTGSTSLTVTYVLEGTATAGADYAALSGSATIPAGDLSAVVTVMPIDDSQVEGDETVILRVTAGTGYTVGSADQAALTIQDNDSEPPPPSGDQQVTRLVLIDADADTDLGDLTDGATLNLRTLPTVNLNVRAETEPAVVGSVRFEYDGNPSYHVENAEPYALAGNSGADYNAWTPTLGVHVLTAVPYTSSGASGAAGTSLTVSFTVIDEDPVPTGPAVTSLTLVNADTDQDIGPLKGGDVIALSALATVNLNVRANTYPDTVGSVRFELDGAVYSTENVAPYALAGDSSGNYKPWTPSVGVHTLRATPYSGAKATGTAGASLTVTFTVTN